MNRGKKDFEMNSTLDYIIHCKVCLNPFGSEDSCPLMLNCGHNFCYSCLQNLIYYDRKVCPTCQNNFHFRSVDDIPVNISVKKVSETANQTMEITRKDLEENTFYVTKGDDKEKRYAKVILNNNHISFENWKDEIEEGSICVDFFNFINSRTSVIDTHTFIEEHKEELHNPKLPAERIKFSKIKVKRREVFFNCFKTLDGSDFVLDFGSLLKTLECSSVVPAEAFLKPKGSSRGEVVITTDGRSPRALNFLLWASGIMDDSYKGTHFLAATGHVYGGCNKKEVLFSGVVDGIQDGGIYERKERKRGDVEGWNANQSNVLSYFWVLKKEYPYSSTTTFARVKRGMKVVDKIVKGDTVDECGLLFDLL